MPRKSRSPQPSNSNLRGSVRIIAGSMRGRSIPFLVSEATRPMKDKTRGAIFNIIGPSLEGFRVFDLFAGTGILAMESLSRGAISATVVELDHRRAKAIDQAGRTLLLTSRLRVVSADAFAWSERWLKGTEASPMVEPWVVFFCPPYPMWDADPAQMERLIQLWAQAAPAGSVLVAESPERRVDHNLPSAPWQWESRRYPPANVLFGWYTVESPGPALE
jgi:16S rRNA (guanine966-N2)-methyltransferase